MQQQGRDPALLDMDSQRLDAHRDVVMPRTSDRRAVKGALRACPIAQVALLVPVAICLAALLVVACATHNAISTISDGFRMFAVVRNPDGSSVACAAFGLTNPVAGILDGQAGARDPVWLRADDGRHLSVVWPEGFTLQFAPDAAIYTDRGTLVGRAGDRIVLDQTRPGDATGTFDDPYFASGLVFGDCYPVVQR